MIRENISLKEFNTFKVGGKSRYFYELKSNDDLLKIADFLESEKVPFVVLGWGSNVLISEEGFHGLVLKISTDKIEWKEKDGGVFEVIVDSGVSWDDLVSQSVEKNLYGLENLSGIPGTVGADPVQNIGAYGTEIKHTLSSLEVFDLKDKNFKILNLKDCDFGYRDSIFKKSENKDLVITKVHFILSRKGELNLSYKDLKNYFASKPNPSLSEVRNAVLKIRSEKFPDLKKNGTAGSFFKNPIISEVKLEELKLEFPEIPYFSTENGQFKISAAWILDKVLDVKGKYFDQVGFFEKQPIVVVNLGGALSHEIKKVTDEIILKTKKLIGIDLEREVTLVGEF